MPTVTKAVIAPSLSRSTLGRRLCDPSNLDRTHCSSSVTTTIDNRRVQIAIQFVITEDDYCRLGRDWFSAYRIAASRFQGDAVDNIDSFDPSLYDTQPVPVNHDLLIDEIIHMFRDPSSAFNAFDDDTFKVQAELHGFSGENSVDRLCLAHHILYGHCSFGKTNECQRLAGSFSATKIRSDIAAAVPLAGLSADQLLFMCKSLGLDKKSVIKKKLLNVLVALLTGYDFKASDTLLFVSTSPSKLSRADLLRIASHHGLSLTGSAETLFNTLSDHIYRGGCLGTRTYTGLRLEGAKRLLTALNLSFGKDDSIYSLREIALDHARSLVAPKDLHVPWQPASRNKLKQKLETIRELWPQRIPEEKKKELIDLFHEHTASLKLKRSSVLLSSLNLDLLKFPLPFSVHDEDTTEGNEIDDTLSDTSLHGVDSASPIYNNDQWDAVRDNFKHFLPFDSGVLRNLLLDPEGVETKENGSIHLQVCSECLRSLKKNKLPKFALANRLFLGEIPDVLKDLTQIEESMIALCRAKNWIVRLPDGSDEHGYYKKRRNWL
ncbi:hypothetical protein H0H93_013721 [Arthromyces matolae]|nr:hypothetical protein H0H93_013721 [Arthromyces matolae]